MPSMAVPKIPSAERSMGRMISRGAVIFTDISFACGDQTRNCTPPADAGRAPNSRSHGMVVRLSSDTIFQCLRKALRLTCRKLDPNLFARVVQHRHRQVRESLDERDAAAGARNR